MRWRACNPGRNKGKTCTPSYICTSMLQAYTIIMDSNLFGVSIGALEHCMQQSIPKLPPGNWQLCCCNHITFVQKQQMLSAPCRRSADHTSSLCVLLACRLSSVLCSKHSNGAAAQSFHAAVRMSVCLWHTTFLCWHLCFISVRQLANLNICLHICMCVCFI